MEFDKIEKTLMGRIYKVPLELFKEEYKIKGFDFDFFIEQEEDGTEYLVIATTDELENEVMENDDKKE